MTRSIAASLLFLTASLQAVSSQLQLRHREKNGVGYTEGYTTVDYFLTHSFGRPEVLFNLRGHVFDDGRLATNVGIGGRYSLGDDACVIGMNAFYDFRESKRLLTSQAGAGLEFLFKNVDVRFNGYLPFADRASSQRRFRRFSGNEIIILQKTIGALPSAECEIGFPITRNFYLAAAPYYLFRQDAGRLNLGEAFGGKIRFSIDIGRYVSLGAMATHDSIFHTTVQGYIGLNIPFGKLPKEKPKQRDLRQVPIFRNEIIPLQKKKKEIPLYHQDSDNHFRTLEVIFVDNSFAGDSDGSFEAPFTSLKEAEEASKPGDIIYVFPGDGTASGMDEGIILKEEQILASSGGSIVIDEIEIPPQTPGEMPVITNIHPDEPVVTNPGQSHLEDFTMIEPWEYLLESWSFDYDTGGDLGGIDAGLGSIEIDATEAIDIDGDGFGGGFSPNSSDGWNHVDVADIDAYSENDYGSGFEAVDNVDNGSNSGSQGFEVVDHDNGVDAHVDSLDNDGDGVDVNANESDGSIEDGWEVLSNQSGVGTGNLDFSLIDDYVN